MSARRRSAVLTRPSVGMRRWAKRIEREILINLSGIAAEANFSRRWNWAGAGGDYESSEILAMYVKPSPLEASAYLQAVPARAFYDLRSKRNWPLVQSVAALSSSIGGSVTKW